MKITTPENTKEPNFFATSLNYASDDPSSKPKIGAFAVGTLLDIDRLDKKTLLRIRAIRTLLHELVQFGADRSQTEFLTAYARDEMRATILHQLPKDIAALEINFRHFKEELDKFRDRYPDLALPDFKIPDDIFVASMFVNTARDKKLYELPIDCANILRGDWTSESIEEFVGRVVWLGARSRVIASQEVINRRQDGTLSWKGFDDLESKYPRPKIKIANSFKLKHPDGIYPLVLLALRSAFQHSYLATLLSDSGEQGEVEIEYASEGESEILLIANMGAPPEHESARLSQIGWERDLDIFRGITGKWHIVTYDNSRYSEYDVRRALWVTQIKFLGQE